MTRLTLSRVMRRRLWILAGSLVCVATAALFFHAVLAPSVLRIAVGPVGSPDLRLVVGFLQAFQRERASVRLKLVITDGSAASAKALDDRKVDLAIARADIAVPANAATVAIMRRVSVYFLTRPGPDIKRIADLRGRNIGILTPGPPSDQVLALVLAQHEMPPDSINRVFGSQAELTQAAQEGRIDAIFMVTPVADRSARMLALAFPHGESERAGFLPVPDVEALVEAHPAYDSYEISRGALGGNPPLPAENMMTLGATYRLFARRDLSESVVSELTRLIATLRLQVAQDVAFANQIELPSTEDRAARLPVHPGTIAYVEGETRTFFERYGDFIYIGIMAVSLLGSALAALVSALIGRKSTAAPDQRLKDLLRLTQSVTEVGSIEELGWIEAESRDVLNDLMRSIGEKDVDAGRIATISFLAAEFRRAAGERRHALMPQVAE